MDNASSTFAKQSPNPTLAYSCCNQKFTDRGDALRHWGQTHSWPYVGPYCRKPSPNLCTRLEDLEQEDLPAVARAAYLLSCMTSPYAVQLLAFRNGSYAEVVSMAYNFLETVRSQSKGYRMFLALLLKADDVDFGINPRHQLPYFLCWANYAYPHLPKHILKQPPRPCRVIVHNWLLQQAQALASNPAPNSPGHNAPYLNSPQD